MEPKAGALNTYRPLAVVTGASSGIGLELAKLLAEDGYDLIMAARDKAGLERWGVELQRRHGIRVRIVPGDLTIPAHVDRVVRAVQGMPVDILVNSAGVGTYGLFGGSNWEADQAMLQLNILALTQLTKRLLPAMQSRHYGRILNIASMAAFMPGPYMAVYYASKAYVLSLSRALASELEGTGVTVTALCPGPTDSGFQKASGITGNKLFNSHLPTATSVASYGYHALKVGKSVAIPGLSNRIAARVLPVLPMKQVLKYVRRAQGPVN